MPTSGDSGNKREITYNAGWKKGRISVAGQHPCTVSSASSSEAHEMRPDRLLARIWSPAPFVPARHVLSFIWVLPAIGFAVILWLVYTLVRL